MNHFARFAAVALLLLPASGALAETETVLHSFAGRDGSFPRGRLSLDSSGSLYGLTVGGGAYTYGTAFELSLDGGSWTESVMHNFGSTPDGAVPWAGLAPTEGGVLFGTTQTGGDRSRGTVFQLKADGANWTESIVHAFARDKHGRYPFCDLLVAKSGHIFGTVTSGGGLGEWGDVFELRSSNGVWKQSLVHSFSYDSDGGAPWAGLVEDQSGALYGTTTRGGVYGGGTAFRLSRAGSEWSFTVLHAFGGRGDGDAPYAGIILDQASGALFGTTYWGGEAGEGTVFRLVPSGGIWKESVLYSFTGPGGAYPEAPLLLDHTGAVFGTTTLGGANNAGTVFGLAQSKGQWTESVIHSFGASGDGQYPYGGLTADKTEKHLYGTTAAGGAAGNGTVYEIAR